MTATTYTPELADKVCAAIADGKSIRAVCKLAGMPSKATVFRWLREHPEFAAAYEVATDERADTMIDEIVDIADNCKVDKDSIRKAKLRIDARVEQAQRMKPKKYGAKITQEHTGNLFDSLLAAVDGTGLKVVP
jgi:transposase-like protein